MAFTNLQCAIDAYLRSQTSWHSPAMSHQMWAALGEWVSLIGDQIKRYYPSWAFFFVGSKAIIHNSPFPKSCRTAVRDKSNREHGIQFNGLSFSFPPSLLPHHDTMTQLPWSLFFWGGGEKKRGLDDRKMRRIMRSLVFKFDKVTSLGASPCPLPLCQVLAEGEGKRGEEKKEPFAL